MAKNPRARTLRREQARAEEKLARDREKLARLEEGGTPERPVVLESASQVEAHARSLRCARCGGGLRLDEHVVQVVRDRRLRLARMTCPACGSRREVWFLLAPPLPS